MITRSFATVSAHSSMHREGLRVVGDARTADEALALTRHLQPDVVVLDVRLPDRDGFEICAEIRGFSPDTRILMCSGLADGSALVQAARAGADGFVSKEADNAEVVDAVRRVANGAAVLGATTAEAMFGHLAGKDPASLSCSRCPSANARSSGSSLKGWTNKRSP